jgi:two-component system phosphate regulon response regulator PhoB
VSRGTILVVDDHRDLVELVRLHLEKEGYQVQGASTGDAALAAALNAPPDAILLDRSMPGLDGLEVCRRLRRDERTASVPVILLTARASEAERVAGFEAGADDYMTKPFSPRELVARVRAALRRAATRPALLEVLQVGELSVDVGRHRVSYRGEEVPLTAGEFRLLRFLVARPGRVLSRTELIDGALGGNVDNLSRTVDVHLAAIRRKLRSGGKMIETVRGVGYRLAEPPVRAVAQRR